VALALQPSQSPKEKGVAKSSAQNAANPQHSDKTSIQPTSQSLPNTSQIAAAPGKPQTDIAADEVEIQRKVEIFTAVLATVGVLQLFVMFLTWAVYRRQAEIMAHQIGTTRDTERAWVVATPTDNAPVIGFIPGGDSTNLERHLVGGDKQSVFGCSFKNTGNTMARLVETAMHYRKVDRLENVPIEPDYGNRDPLNDLPVAPGDSIGFVQFLEPSAILPKAEYDAVWRGQTHCLRTLGIALEPCDACSTLVSRDICPRRALARDSVAKSRHYDDQRFQLY
jgi:hypothetical protein